MFLTYDIHIKSFRIYQVLCRLYLTEHKYAEKNLGRTNPAVQDGDLWSSLILPLPSLRWQVTAAHAVRMQHRGTAFQSSPPRPGAPSPSLLPPLLRPYWVEVPQGQRPWRVQGGPHQVAF